MLKKQDKAHLVKIMIDKNKDGNETCGFLVLMWIPLITILLWILS